MSVFERQVERATSPRFPSLVSTLHAKAWTPNRSTPLHGPGGRPNLEVEATKSNNESRNPNEYRHPNAKTADLTHCASFDFRALDFFRHLSFDRSMVPLHALQVAVHPQVVGIGARR